MILSKASLQIAHICKKDSKIPLLDNIRIEPDGTVLASARNAVIAVTPVPIAVADTIPLDKTGDVNCTVSSDTIRHILSAIKDIAFGGMLEFTNVMQDGNSISFEYRDGKRRSKVESKALPEKWIPWQNIFRNAFKRKCETRVILNRSRLRMLLEVLDKTSPDKGGEMPVYLEFTNDNNIICRAYNSLTAQWTFAVMTTYKQGMNIWPEETEFEKKLMKSGKKKRNG